MSEPLALAVRPWPTPCSRDDRSAGGRLHTRGGTSLADEAARPWASPTASDVRSGWTQDDPERAERRNLVGDQVGGARLSPAWVEALLGFPVGWTLPDGPRLAIEATPRWPRGRYSETWDRSVPWPGYDWEPPRTLTGPPVPGRPARLRALGNAVVPQQGALAIRTALDEARRAPGLFWSAHA